MPCDLEVAIGCFQQKLCLVSIAACCAHEASNGVHIYADVRHSGSPPVDSVQLLVLANSPLPFTVSSVRSV